MFLSTSSWSQVKDYVEQRTIALVPIGACENHGAHLGLGTDALLPEGIARPVIKTSDPGWYGPLSPLDATPEWGKEMIDAFVDFTVTFLERFERAPLE